MATSESESSGPSDENAGIQSDEDWKQRIKAKDAALDATLKSEDAEDAEVAKDHTAAASDASAKRATAAPMPPATFDVLVSMLSTQAMVGLGLVPNPATGKTERMPELAKHFIDLLGVIETKTTGNLEQSEKTALDSALHHLHMAYVQISKEDAGEDSSNESKQQ